MTREDIIDVVDVEDHPKIMRHLNYMQNMSFDVFKSELSHMFKEATDYEVASMILRNHFIERFWNNGWPEKAYYCLAILDYIAEVKGAPKITLFDDLKEKYKIPELIFPRGILIRDALGTEPKENAIEECANDPVGKHFLKYNIIERSFRDAV